LGLAVGDDGQLFVADGGFTYLLRPGDKPTCVGMLFTPGFPGYTRGVAAAGPGTFIVTTANGDVARWQPAKQEHEVLASGLDQPYGVALAPGGDAIVAERVKGRVVAVRAGKVEELATGLREVMGVAIAPDGAPLVSETGGGRIVKLAGGRVETVLDGLKLPEGIAVRGQKLYVVDTGAKELIEYDLTTKSRRAIATSLPVGAPAGVKPIYLNPFLPLCGSMGPFAGLAVGTDGTLYVSADAEGSVLAVRPA
jgi:glucose/arabinose dehydrogenase